jgi:hypothetical protein
MNSHLLVIFGVSNLVVVDASLRRRNDDEVKQSFEQCLDTRNQRKQLTKSFDSRFIWFTIEFRLIHLLFQTSKSRRVMFNLEQETKHLWACTCFEFASSAWRRRDENKRFELLQTFLFHRFVNTDYMQTRIVLSLCWRVVDVISSSRENLVDTVEYTISQTACNLQWKSRLYLYNTSKISRQAKVRSTRRRLKDVYETSLSVLQHDY